MTQVVDVDIVIHGKSYTLACPRGQEARLRTLAEAADERVGKIWRQMGKKMVLSETKLLVMALLMLADELFDARQASSKNQSGDDQLASESTDIDDHYEQKIQALADKISTMSSRLAVTEPV